MKHNLVKIAASTICMVMLLMALTGCYYWKTVEPHEFAILTKDGVSIDKVAGAGRYTDAKFRASIEVINAESKVLEWVDNSLLTLDRQSISFELLVTYARSVEYAEFIWTEYRSSAQDDTVLEALVRTKIPDVVLRV